MFAVNWEFRNVGLHRLDVQENQYSGIHNIYQGFPGRKKTTKKQ